MSTATIPRGAASVDEVDTDRIRLYELASLLLSHPDTSLVESGYSIANAAADLVDDRVRQPVLDFLAWFAVTEPVEIEQHYAAHYLRGCASVGNEEPSLSDLLPLVLEFAAFVRPDEGDASLRRYEHDIESKRASLAEIGSPYAWLLEALLASLSSTSRTLG